MKRKVLAIFMCLSTILYCIGCGNNNTESTQTGSNDEKIEELEERLEELEAENKELKDQLKNQESQESQQQSSDDTASIMETTVNSAEANGVCGADLTWYYKNGVLVIKGTGEMADFIHDTEWNNIINIPWYEFKDNIGWVIIDEGVTSIGKQAFYEHNAISKIVLPSTLTSIGTEAFGSCYNLKEIVIPNSVTSIGWEVFNHCSNLEKIIMSDSITSIDYNSFNMCDNLKEITYKGETYTVKEFNEAMKAQGIMEQ